MWSEVAIGTVQEIRCPCRVSVPFNATRVCAGDFVSGGEWQRPSDSACNFDDLAAQLCQLPEVIANYRALFPDLSLGGLVPNSLSSQTVSHPPEK